MNDTSRWRLAHGSRVAQAYASNPNVAAAIVGGSTAGGYADRYSDIEVGIFWRITPTDDERLTAANATAGDVHRLYPYDPAEEVWEDVIFMGRAAPDQPVTGVMVEVVHYTLDTIESVLTDVLEHYDTSDLKQKLLAVFEYAVPVKGEDIISDWRSRTAHYPRGLALAIVKQHAQIEFFWRTDMALERGNNLLLVYDTLVQVSVTLLHLLFALNRIYFTGLKWIHLQIPRMQIVPPNFEHRLRHNFESDPRTAIQELPILVEEVYSLIELEMPEIDVNRLRHFFRYRPHLWEEAPPVE